MWGANSLLPFPQNQTAALLPLCMFALPFCRDVREMFTHRTYQGSPRPPLGTHFAVLYFRSSNYRFQMLAVMLKFANSHPVTSSWKGCFCLFCLSQFPYIQVLASYCWELSSRWNCCKSTSSVWSWFGQQYAVHRDLARPNSCQSVTTRNKELAKFHISQHQSVSKHPIHSF